MGSLIVGCKDGSLRLCDIQLEGKKPCSDKELLNGIKSEILISEN
jgi:methionyl-tRNA formyltransferase